MYLQKVISSKTFLKNYFFVGVLKVNDENSRIRIQIRIRIHTKISWIRNTSLKLFTPIILNALSSYTVLKGSG
jgi:hypothetical protein